ncbi:MUC1 isoform 4 [Pongo abelii]|uniref:Mucin-1 n=1 Tax=Pongo abelii TaxID=9601 RepID=A0A2J8VG90_PONAB|nr:MUC1 isoform 4 [Pongo abelii]
MTPGTQSPFFLLLLLTVLTVVTGSGHASSTPGGEKETSATQRSSMPSSTEKNAVSMTSSVLSSHSPGSGSSTTQGQDVTSAPATEPASGSAATWGQDITSVPVTRSALGSTTPPAHDVTSAPDSKPAPGSTTPPAHDFNSSLEDPSTNYYQELQRDISELFLQIYKQGGFLGCSNIKFRPGSVVVQSTLAFREGTTNAHDVETQFNQHKTEAASRYNLTISDIRVSDVPFPFSAQSGAGVPGWGIALLVLVCVLVALAVVYLIALAVCQCRRKNYGQLDIFPARDAYHPMSEYPTYHTHGRYVPPSSTNHSPYEKVSAGNGGSSLSYTNPAVAATSANL